MSEEGQILLDDKDRWKDNPTLLREYNESRKRERTNEDGTRENIHTHTSFIMGH